MTNNEQKYVKETIKSCLAWKKEYFKYNSNEGWILSSKGQNEFSRLKHFL